MREMKESGIEWIGTVPGDWNTNPIRNIVIKRDGGAWGIDPNESDYGTICLRIADFDYEKGVFKLTAEDELTYRKYSSTQKYRLQLQKDDILIEKSGGGEKTPVGRAVLFDKKYEALFANFMDRIQIDKSKASALFVEYWLRALYACRVTPFYIKQTTGIQNLDLTMLLGKEKFFFPQLTEQQEITSFLDSKCAEIDELTADIQSQIDTLEAYKRSVITEAVTKSLNPEAEMKDSGIDDIGAIPKHWELRKIKYLFSLSSSKNYLPLKEVQLLSLYTDLGVFPHGEQEERGNKAVTADGYMIVHKNDIVVNIILAWMGAIGMSNYDGVTSPAYDIYRPNLEVVHPEFYHFLFRTKWFSGECYKYGRGIMAMRWRTYSTEFKNIPVPYPPLSEQKTIVDYLHNKCAEIERTIAEKKQQLATLNEYKKSLIYEYVTGKKEVSVS